MAKPPFREYDDMPRRGDDIKINALGVTVEASGRIVFLTIVCFLAFGLAVWGVFRNEAAHAVISRTLEVTICVLTLNEEERREYRTEGKYCPSPGRVQFRDERGLRDETARRQKTT
jgi:hypothetical protein